MYSMLKSLVLKMCRVPPEPDDPMGDVEQLKVFRASPAFFTYRLCLWILKNTVLMLFALAAAGIGSVTIYSAVKEISGSDKLSVASAVIAAVLLLLFFTVQLAISYIVLRLDYEMRWYKITDRSLRIREGVVLVREMTMTFANIQNISITQGPVQKYFGISDLKVQTAGGGGLAASQQQGANQASFNMHVGYFRGVDNAAYIRDMMASRLRKAKDAGLGDRDDEPGGARSETENENSSFIEALAALSSELSALRKGVETNLQERS